MSTDDMEHMFAIDLISFVMERRKMGWKFHKYFLKNIQSIPFTPVIRNIVSNYLGREETNIYFYYMQTKAAIPDCNLFLYFIEYARSNIFSSVSTVTELIRYCCLITQCSFLAYQNGAHLAPYFALGEVREAIKTFISHQKESPIIFWATLDSKASSLLPDSFTKPEAPDIPLKYLLFIQQAKLNHEKSLKEFENSLLEQKEESQSSLQPVPELEQKPEDQIHNEQSLGSGQEILIQQK